MKWKEIQVWRNETTSVKLQTKTKKIEARSGNWHLFHISANRGCLKKNLRINWNIAMKTFTGIQLGPPNHGSWKHVTIVVLSYDVTFWQNHSPYFHLRHFTDPGLFGVEAPPTFPGLVQRPHYLPFWSCLPFLGQSLSRQFPHLSRIDNLRLCCSMWNRSGENFHH